MKKLLFASAVLFSVGLSAQWNALPTNVNWDFYGITFISTDTGTVVGTDSTHAVAEILHTTDGGASWSAPAFPSGLEPLNDVDFYGSLNGCIVGNDGCVLVTNNGGNSWDTVTRFTGENLYCVSFPTMTTIFAGGENGSLFRSYDAGQSWDTLSSGTLLAIRDLYFIHAGAGWIVGDGGYLAATGDGGDSFVYFAQPYFGFYNPLGYAYVGTSNVAFCVGEDGLAISSQDAGLTWNTFSMPVNEDLHQVAFLNDLSGIICGDGGFIYVTLDGGINWSVQSNSSHAVSLRDIAFGGDTTAFICGDNGRVLRNQNDISGIHPYTSVSLNAGVYPNPFENELNITVDLENNSEVILTITDLSGRIVLQENKGELSAGKNTIRPNGIVTLVPGMYIVQINAGGNVASLPVIRK